MVFIGGDARQLEVIKNCIEGKARVSLIGFDNLQSPFSGAVNRELTENLLKTTDILILPILGTDEEGFVDSIFTTKKLVLTERHIASLPHHVTIFSGIAKSYLKDLSEKYSIRLVELLKRDDVAIYNSIPTVEGALMMAIQNTNITIHGSTCAVLGLGRVGMTLGRTLTALGAQVKMGVHRPDQAARAEEMGLKAFFTKDIHDQVDDVELLFNTVPSLISLPNRVVSISSMLKREGSKRCWRPAYPESSHPNQRAGFWPKRLSAWWRSSMRRVPTDEFERENRRIWNDGFPLHP